MRACFAAGGADLGAYYKRETRCIFGEETITIFLGGSWRACGSYRPNAILKAGPDYGT